MFHSCAAGKVWQNLSLFLGMWYWNIDGAGSGRQAFAVLEMLLLRVGWPFQLLQLFPLPGSWQPLGVLGMSVWHQAHPTPRTLSNAAEAMGLLLQCFFSHKSSQGAEGHFQGLCLSKAFEGQAQVVCRTASYPEIKSFQNWCLLIRKQYAGYRDNRFLSVLFL